MHEYSNYIDQIKTIYNDNPKWCLVHQMLLKMDEEQGVSEGSYPRIQCKMLGLDAQISL